MDCVECGRRAVRVAIARRGSGEVQGEEKRVVEVRRREDEKARTASGVVRVARGRRLPARVWETKAGSAVDVLDELG